MLTLLRASWLTLMTSVTLLLHVVYDSTNHLSGRVPLCQFCSYVHDSGKLPSNAASGRRLVKPESYSHVYTKDKAAQDKANLTRIRDNQRRSRARRKEYLQEIEQRLRAYEQQGVEASAEIQQAARRVVDENRKLRTLLNDNDVDDATIEAYLQASRPGFPSTIHGSASTEESAIQVLDRLLAPRHMVMNPGHLPLLSWSSQEEQRNSLSFDDTNTDGSVAAPLHGSTSEGLGHSTAAHHRHTSLGSGDNPQGYPHPSSNFSAERRHGFEMDGLHLNATASRPNILLQPQTVSDPTDMWSDKSQISPVSTVHTPAIPMQQGQLYMNRPVQFTQHQIPTFSDPWHPNMVSVSRASGSEMLSDGMVPLLPIDAAQLARYSDPMEDEEHRPNHPEYRHHSGRF